LDKYRKSQLLHIIRSIPKHVVTKQSWVRLKNEPIRCVLWVLGPVLFTFTQRKFRDEKTALQTTQNRLIDLIGAGGEVIPIHLWPHEPHLVQLKSSSEVDKLTLLLTSHGSDKALLGYVDVYQVIFASIRTKSEQSVPTIVEIGIGSRNPALASNMGAFGIPGASLRAFSEYSPTANIIGGDVDLDTLFQEERIKTFHVDQLNQDSLTQFLVQSGSYDLLIDDGLHELDANLNTLLAALVRSKVGSWIVIEDISPDTADVWLAVAELLKGRYLSWLVKAPQSMVFIVLREL
jgi:hypothetical protein